MRHVQHSCHKKKRDATKQYEVVNSGYTGASASVGGNCKSFLQRHNRNYLQKVTRILPSL